MSVITYTSPISAVEVHEEMYRTKNFRPHFKTEGHIQDIYL